MAEMKGKLCTCDRCGKTVFLKTTGNGEADGGFTKWNIFEPYPIGWKSHGDTGMLCPKCNDQYENMMKRFMEAAICKD